MIRRWWYRWFYGWGVWVPVHCEKDQPGALDRMPFDVFSGDAPPDYKIPPLPRTRCHMVVCRRHLMVGWHTRWLLDAWWVRHTAWEIRVGKLSVQWIA